MGYGSLVFEAKLLARTLNIGVCSIVIRLSIALKFSSVGRRVKLILETFFNSNSTRAYNLNSFSV